MRLKDKVAIVTGGGQGFGEGIVERFAQDGCKVIVNDLNAETAERVAKAINAKGGKAAAVQGDVAKDADWAKILKFTVDTFGGLPSHGFYRPMLFRHHCRSPRRCGRAATA